MTLVRQLWRIVNEILKEISDQNAYERHLKAHRVEHSPEEWRRFSDHHLGHRFKTPKCC